MKRHYLGNACITTESRSKACVCISPNPSVKPTCMIRPLKAVFLLLSEHCLPGQCLLHLLPTHMTKLMIYLPQAPAGDCSYQRGGEGYASPTGSRGNWWAKLTSIPPVTGNLPQLPCNDYCHHVLPTTCPSQWGVPPRLCFRCARVSYPLNHLCLCCCLQAFVAFVADFGCVLLLTSVLKLGK